MRSIDLMVKEHDYILEVIKVVRNACCKIVENEEVCIEDFKDVITFVREYADKHHHGKEEEVLFRDMVNELGSAAKKLVQNGMLVEHDLGRYYIAQLEKALDAYSNDKSSINKLNIIANAMAWADLLERHIEKENQVVYNFAIRNFSDEKKNAIDNEVDQLESKATESGIQEKSLLIVNELKSKYL
ncbi:MAG: hemerythrin domain-containing protein [Anaerorhabdus sp.]